MLISFISNVDGTVPSVVNFKAKEYILFASLEVLGARVACVHPPLPALLNLLLLKLVPSLNILSKVVSPSTSYLTSTFVVPPVL